MTAECALEQLFQMHEFAVLGDFAHFSSGSKNESTVQADPPTAHSVIIHSFPYAIATVVTKAVFDLWNTEPT